MKRTLIISVIILLAAGTSLLAQPFPPQPDMGKPFMHKMMIEQLKLSEEQQKQFKDLHFKNEKNEIEVRAQIKLLRLEMKQALSEDNIDKSDVLSISEKISKLQGELKTNKLKMMLEINDMLSADQRKIWKDNILMMGNDRMDGPRAPKFDMPYRQHGRRSN